MAYQLVELSPEPTIPAPVDHRRKLELVPNTIFFPPQSDSLTEYENDKEGRTADFSKADVLCEEAPKKKRLVVANEFKPDIKKDVESEQRPPSMDVQELSDGGETISLHRDLPVYKEGEWKQESMAAFDSISKGTEAIARRCVGGGGYANSFCTQLTRRQKITKLRKDLWIDDEEYAFII